MGMRRFTAAEPEAHPGTGHIPAYQGLAMGLAPAPSLLHALVRECRDMSPTLSMEVTCIGSLGPSRCIGVGWLRPEYYMLLPWYVVCYYSINQCYPNRMRIPIPNESN